MKLSPKHTVIGLGLTAGALGLMHNRFEDTATSNEQRADTLRGCVASLASAECVDAVTAERIEPVIQINGLEVTMTYTPDQISQKADAIDAGEGADGPLFEGFMYGAVLLVGAGLTVMTQSESGRRALAGRF